MQLKKIFLTLLSLALFANPAFSQDTGIPDTVDLVVSLNPDANANQLNVEVQLWVYNDDSLIAANMGFGWDNPNLQMDSAVATAVGNMWAFGPFFFENSSIATTNANKRFLFADVAIALFPPDATGRRHWATYYFTLSNWTTSDEINIDTLAFNVASVFEFITTGVYKPIWTGALKITDPNAPPPSTNLIVSPDTVSATAVESGTDPAPDTVDVTEAGGGNIGFSVTELISWASVSPLSGTTPAELVVSYGISGLAPGTYFDSISVSSGEADNSPQYIYVSLQVNAAEKILAVSPDTLLFSAVEGTNPAVDSFLVSETGDFNIAFSVSESSLWFSLNKSGGTTNEYISVSVSSAGLSPGTYFDSVMVSSGDATNSPIYEYVRLVISTADKFLAVSPDTLSFSMVEAGAIPANQLFTVSETGGFNIAFSVSESSAWFSLNKTGGITNEDVTVSINITSLSPGTYFDSVQVSSGDANNSPIFEYVSLEVIRADKFLAVSPDTIFWSATHGGPNPSPDSFLVTETGGFNIQFFISHNTEWFIATLVDNITPVALHIFPDTDLTAMPPGIYSGEIMISSGEANNSPIFAVVILEITTAPILLEVAPTSISLSVTDGGAAFSPVLISVSDSAGAIFPYSLLESSFWFNVSKTNGSSPDTFSVIADTTNLDSLPPGMYKDTIVVTADTAFNSPVIIVVSLEILEEPNIAPVLDTIGNATIFEGDTLTIGVSAFDADGDTLFLSVSVLSDNMNFTDNGDGTGQFRFMPSFSQAGVYPLTAHASDGRDTVSESFTITVEDKQPGSEGDTLVVATIPAVPGQQVSVPLNITNSCDVFGISIPLIWDGDSSIVLDSFVFNETNFGGVSIKTTAIDNNTNFAQIDLDVDGGAPIAPANYALGKLYFSVDCFTPHGVYGVTPVISFLKADTAHPSTIFLRDCGGGQEAILPVIPGGGGNIIVDTTGAFVCGYVISPDTVGIAGATVELWADYPSSGPSMTTTTNGNGAFAFTEIFLGNFDLYAYKGSSDSTTFNGACYPNNVHANSGDKGLMIILFPVEPITPVDQWVDYFCDTNTLFGAPLPVGSIVEAQDPGGLICGRFFVNTPSVYGFMPVYRDSTGSTEDEGATTGDNIRFFINGVEALTTGNTIYPDAYDTVRVCLAGGERKTLDCPLTFGWNLVSWNLVTDADDIEDVLSSLAGCVEVVLGFEQGGLTYVPGMEIFNTLNKVDNKSGYWIKIDPNCIPISLSISGVPVEVTTPIPLYTGWNLVTYWPDPFGEPFNDLDGDGIFTPGIDQWVRVEHDLNENGVYDGPGELFIHPSSAWKTIRDNLEIAYTYDGGPLVYIPSEGIFNTLTEVELCFGYWLKVDADVILTYPTAHNFTAPEFDAGEIIALAKTVKRNVEPTRSWVNLFSYNLTLDNLTVPAGAIVTAHSTDGTKIGHFELAESGQFGFMPVYADLFGEQVTGISKGDVFFLEIDGMKTREEFSWTDQGALIEVAALTTGGNPDDNLPGSYSLSQNYPNPFNPSTTINFSLPAAGEARIEIFNLLGQIVAIPFDGMADAGETKVIWDGRTLSGETAASGIYLYRLTADNRQIETRKMTLLK